MVEYVVKKEENLLKSITEQVPNVSFSELNKLLRKKDIKVNDRRINENIKVVAGDKVCVYINLQSIKNYEIVYDDDNILIINKNTGIEVTGEAGLEELFKKQNKNINACHRLDRNTSGLVIFSKNEQTYNAIIESFLADEIKKYYMAFIKGVLPYKEKSLTAYLFKDAKKSQVFIYDKKTIGSKIIKTNVKHIKTVNGNSLIEVEIPTGRTHQIRAHLSYLGYPIIGDDKYGDAMLNKEYKLKKQCLCAYKLKFNFDEDCHLNYLNQKDFEIKIPFIKYIK